jgi:hypothetical protein
MIRISCQYMEKNVEIAGKRDREKTNRTPFSGLLPEFSPREDHGPVAI